MNLLVLICAMVAATKAVPVDIAKAGTKAASPYVNYGCQCDSLTFLDKYGRIQGNCKSTDETGARWCYLPLHGYNTCTDVGHGQTSSRFPGRQWSYEACATPPPPAYPQYPAYPQPSLYPQTPAYPQYPAYPQPSLYPQPPVHGYGITQPPVHPGAGGCLITKDGSGCQDKGHPGPGGCLITKDGSGCQDKVHPGPGGCLITKDGYGCQDETHGVETNIHVSAVHNSEKNSDGEVEGTNNTSEGNNVAETNNNEFEDNSVTVEITENSSESSNTAVEDLEDSKSKSEGDSFGSNIVDYGRAIQANLENQRRPSNSRLKFSKGDKSKIRFSE